MAPDVDLALFTNVADGGGVGRLARQMLGGLAARAASRDAQLRALALHDPRGERAFDIGGDRARVRGFAGDRAAFARAALLTAGGARGVFANHPHLAPLARACAAFRRAPLVVAGHGIDVWEPLPALRRSSLRAAHRVILSSRHSLDQARAAQSLDPARLRAVHPALDPSFEAAARAISPAAPEGARILAVTRLSASDAYKGVDRLVEAMPTVRAKRPDATLDIVGEGDHRAALEALAREAGVADAVRFLGALDDAALARAYAGATLFALPSRREGFGIAYLEAAAFGRPSLCSAAGGAPEAVIDGRTGWCLRTDTPDAIAVALLQALDDPAELARRGAAARERALASYGYAAYRARFLDALEGLA